MTTYLTPHFTLEEMIASDTAKAKKIDNTPNENTIKVLKHTCEYLLEPLREILAKEFGDKVYIGINSGYRCEKLNTAIGGAKNSQHKTGEGADCKFYVVQNKIKKLLNYELVYQAIKKNVKAGIISVDQCIIEHSKNSIWIHLSYSASGKTKNRNQFLRYNNGKYSLD